MNVTSYKQGTPCWVDLGTPDPDATAAFFSGLFGWTANRSDDPGAGGYVMFEMDGVPVAGAGPLMADGQPSVWTTYFAVDNADAATGRIEAAGGTTLMPPFDVMDTGRMGIYLDNDGAAFGVWQGRGFGGAGVVNEPGSLVWNELMSRDVDGAVQFYRNAFGLNASSKTAEGGADAYTEFQVDGRSVAGMMSMANGQFPPELPAHWLTYFATADTDATVARVVQLGGRVSMPPTTIPVGRFAIVTDPHGAPFAVIAMA
jgi:predicted enzyme related to lactoylglutathione lyase